MQVEYISKIQLDLLQYYRQEIRHEFSLLSTRLNLLITCQSFLVVPFAILNTASNFKLVFIPEILIIILGAYTSWLIQHPLILTQKLIREWIQKQRQLLKQVQGNEYKNNRDLIEGEEIDIEHERSLIFSKQAPIVFLIFWIASFLWTVLRLLLEL